MEKMIHFKNTAIHISLDNGPKNTSQSRDSAKSTFGMYIASFLAYIGGKKVPNCALSGNIIAVTHKQSIEPSNTSLIAPLPSSMEPFDKTLGEPNFISFLINNFAVKA